MIIVDKDKCIGCGLCSGMCPDTFVMDEDGKSEAIRQEVSDCAKQAAEACPVEAITVSE